MIFTIWTLAAFCISHLLSFIKIVFAFEDYDTYYFTWSTIRYSTVDLYRASCLSYHYCLSWIFLKSLGVMSSSLWMVNFSFAGLGFNHKGFLIRVFEERVRELLFLFSLLICFSIYSFPLPASPHEVDPNSSIRITHQSTTGDTICNIQPKSTPPSPLDHCQCHPHDYKFLLGLQSF